MNSKDTKKPTKKEETRIQLDLIHGFGSLGHSELKDGFTFIEDDGIKLGFPIGKQFAIKPIDKAEMNFIRFHENLESITSLCVSKNRKYFAVSGRMRGDDCPQLSIYTIKGGANREKERIFRYTESKSNVFTHMCFGEDTRFLVMLTGQEDPQLVFLDTTRMRTMGTMALNGRGTRVSISPRDNHVVTVSGDRIFKILRVQENTFKYLGDVANLNTNQRFTEHTWADEHKLLLANDQATIYIIMNSQVVQVLNNCFNLSENDPQASVSSIVAFSRGFVIGGDNGTFSVWIKNEDVDPDMGQKNFFNFLRTRKPPEGLSEELLKKGGIVSLDVSPSEDLLAVCFKNNDLATVSMNQLVPSTADVVDPFKLKKLLEKDIQFDYLYNGFHNGSITNIDICVQRPLIATCSQEDSTIRIWNYANFRCELAVMFSVREDHKNELNPLLSIAFHPSGYYLAVGFIDRLEIFHVCSEELRSYRMLTQVKSVNCVKFSRSGHMLAIAYPRPNHSHYWVNVYDSYTLEQICLPLKGPVDTIKQLIWANDDESLISCGADGTICEWNVLDNFTMKEYPVTPDTKLAALTYTQNGGIVACGKQGGKPIVKEIIPKKDAPKLHSLNWGNMSQITTFRGFYNTPAIIGGTDRGFITLFPGTFETQPYEFIPSHMSEVISVLVSPDGKYLFTAGKDQCILVYQVQELIDGGLLLAKAATNAKEGEENRDYNNPYATAVDDNLADVVLLSQNEIEKFRSEIRQLRLEVDDLQSRIEITAEEDRRRMAKEHAVAEENMNITVKGWQKRCEEIQREKVSMEKEYENLLRMMETNHLKAVEELETLYDKKLAYENEKYLQIEQELIEEENKHSKKEKKVKAQHTDTIGRLEHQYRDEFSKTQKIFETNKNTAEQIKTEYDEKLKEIEDEHEAEIRDLNNQHKKEIGKLDEEILHLTEANTKYRREYKETKDEREGLKKSEEEKESDIKQLKLNLNEAFMTIDANRKKLEDLKNTVEEKKKKIGRYKYKVTDLQKSKHVLSYRTTEMRKNLEPKEAQIDKLKDELFKLEKEFESMLKTSQVQNDKLVKEEKKIEALQTEIDTKNSTIAKKEMLIHKIKMDIYTAIRTKEPKEYPNEMKKLFRDYCSDNEIKEGSAHDPRSIEEMVRQIQHLEKSIYQINRGTEKTVKRREQDIHRKTLENSDLICDLNDLRKNNKKLESDIYNITKENDELKREKKVLIDDRTKLRNVLTRLNAQSSRGNFLPQLQTTHQSDGQIPPLLKARIDQAAGVSKTRFGKGAMNDLKSQSMNDKNRLVELMAEIDICNQRLMQQESEFNVLAEKLRRSGADEGMALQYEDQGQSMNMDAQLHNPNSAEHLGKSNPTSDRFQGMKTGLQVRSTLMKMSQHD